MRPLNNKNDPQLDLFRERLKNILDPRHELCRLADLINWDLFEEEFGKYYCVDNGRPGTPIRLMVGLTYLEHAYGLSDEEVVNRWVENPYWQYFCGSPTRISSFFPTMEKNLQGQ